MDNLRSNEFTKRPLLNLFEKIIVRIYLKGLIRCIALVSSTLLAKETPANLLESAQTNILQSSMLYRDQALERMAQEASWFCKNLHLSNAVPIQPHDILPEFYIRPPRTGFGGIFRTTNYLFRFSTRLDGIYRRDKQEERFDLYPIWARTPSLIDSNGAYQLATQWLSAIAVDVPVLQKKYPPKFYQWFYWGREAGVPDSEWNQHRPTTNKVMMPIYDVYWGEQGTPAIKVTVFGPTKELMVFEMYDPSLSLRPPIVITNWQELLSIPDPPINRLIAPSTDSTNRPKLFRSENVR